MWIPSHGHGRMAPTFQPGQAGNPLGKGGVYREVLQLARQASPDAMRKLIGLMDDSDSRVALMACDKVLERAWGKVKDVDDKDAADPGAVERRAATRAEVFRMLQSLAQAEPLAIAGRAEGADQATSGPDAGAPSGPSEPR